MQNTRSRLEARLDRMLATTPPPTARYGAVAARIDLVFLTEEDQRRLDQEHP